MKFAISLIALLINLSSAKPIQPGESPDGFGNILDNQGCIFFCPAAPVTSPGCDPVLGCPISKQ